MMIKSHKRYSEYGCHGSDTHLMWPGIVNSHWVSNIEKMSLELNWIEFALLIYNNFQCLLKHILI